MKSGNVWFFMYIHVRFAFCAVAHNQQEITVLRYGRIVPKVALRCLFWAASYCIQCWSGPKGYTCNIYFTEMYQTYYEEIFSEDIMKYTNIWSTFQTYWNTRNDSVPQHLYNILLQCKLDSIFSFLWDGNKAHHRPYDIIIYI